MGDKEREKAAASLPNPRAGHGEDAIISTTEPIITAIRFLNCMPKHPPLESIVCEDPELGNNNIRAKAIF